MEHVVGTACSTQGKYMKLLGHFVPKSLKEQCRLEHHQGFKPEHCIDVMSRNIPCFENLLQLPFSSTAFPVHYHRSQLLASLSKQEVRK
jgi:hypothetical protein